VTKRVERLVNLCTLLLRPRAAAPAEEIRRAIPQYQQFKSAQAFHKALQRDVRALRDVGVPVEVNEHNEYYISEREYSLPLVSFSAQELYSLALACKAASALGSPIEDYAASAWRKITFDQWRETQQLPDPEELLSIRPAPLAPKLERRDLETLFEALLLRKRLALRYQDRQGQVTSREFDPYALAVFDGQWYLVGLCHLRGELRTLRCSRIVSLTKGSTTRPEEPDFEVPPDFRLRRHVGQLKWRLRPRHDPIAASVSFSPKVWWWVKRHWGEAGQVEERGDGGGLLSLLVTDKEAFLQLVLEFGSNAQILEPADLRREATQALSRIISAHR